MKPLENVDAAKIERAVKLFEYHVGLLDAEVFRKANDLQSNIVNPLTANADEIWQVLLDKPLWANANAKSIDDKVSLIKRHLTGKWGEMADPDGPYRIDRRPGVKGYKNNAFVLIGSDAQLVLDSFKIARYRFYRMLGAARVLEDRASSSATPFSYLAELSVQDAIRDLMGLDRRIGLGEGWGVVTTMHFLTDLGLTCKPDRQLIRALRILELWSAPESAVTFEQAIYAHDVALSLHAALKSFRLRELDYLLMQFGVQASSSRNSPSWTPCHSSLHQRPQP